MRGQRGQSNVVGVALLLAVTVVALGTMTASVGVVIERNAETADAVRVAADFERALAPVETTGRNRGRVTFTDGQLRTVEREFRILNTSGVVRTMQVDKLAFTAGENRVSFLNGAISTGSNGHYRFRRPPLVTASTDGGSDGVLVVGTAVLNASQVAVSGALTNGVVLRTTVTHRRIPLGTGTYRVAVETQTPDVWSEFFRSQNATVTTTDQDFDGDGVTSVIARYPGERVAYLVIHDMRLEVRP